MCLSVPLSVRLSLSHSLLLYSIHFIGYLKRLFLFCFLQNGSTDSKLASIRNLRNTFFSLFYIFRTCYKLLFFYSTIQTHFIDHTMLSAFKKWECHTETKKKIIISLFFFVIGFFSDDTLHAINPIMITLKIELLSS